MAAVVLSHTAFNLDRRMKLAMDTPFEGVLSFDEAGSIIFVNHFFSLNCNCKLNTSVKWQQPQAA